MLLGGSTTNQFRSQAWNKSVLLIYHPDSKNDRIWYMSISFKIPYNHFLSIGRQEICDLFPKSQRQVVEDTRHRSSIDPWGLRRGMFCQLGRAKGGGSSHSCAKWKKLLPSVSVLSAPIKCHMRANILTIFRWWWQITKLWFCCKPWTQMLFIDAWHWQLDKYICHQRGSIQWKSLQQRGLRRHIDLLCRFTNTAMFQCLGSQWLF